MEASNTFLKFSITHGGGSVYSLETCFTQCPVRHMERQKFWPRFCSAGCNHLILVSLTLSHEWLKQPIKIWFPSFIFSLQTFKFCPVRHRVCRTGHVPYDMLYIIAGFWQLLIPKIVSLTSEKKTTSITPARHNINA